MLKFELNDIVPEPPSWLNWLLKGDDDKTPIPPCTRAAVLVIDVSGSMSEADYPPTRLEAAVAAASAFARKLAEEDPEAAVALVSYGTRAKCVRRPIQVTELAVFEAALAKLQIDGCTNMAAGLKVAQKTLDQVAASQKQVVLLTDGHANEGGCPLNIANGLRKTAIIECVGIGGQPSDVDEKLLKKIASKDEANRPRYRWIGDRQQLVTHFKRLAGRIVA